MLKDSLKTYIVVDALDECPTPRDREEVIKFLGWLSSTVNNNLYVLFTSRPDSEGINSAFGGIDIPKDIVRFDPRQIDADINRHLSSMLRKHPYQRWSDVLKTKVISHLTSHSDGIFRWADLQMQELAGKLRQKDVEKALKHLPKNLGQTYERMLHQIDQNDYKEEAWAVLNWLAYSRRPLTLAEVSEIAAFEVIQSDGDLYELAFDPANRFENPWEIRRILGGLVTVSASDIDDRLEATDTIDSRDVTLLFSHFSVREYLESNMVSPSYFHIDWHSGQWFMVNSCAEYICYSLKMEDEPQETLFPLLLYAYFNLWLHLQQTNITYSGRSKDTDLPSYSVVLSRYPGLRDCTILMSPLFINSHHGCGANDVPIEARLAGDTPITFVGEFLESNTLQPSPYESESLLRRYPLHKASTDGDVDVARLCLRAGLSPNELKPKSHRARGKVRLGAGPLTWHGSQEFETPLALAVWHEHEEVAKLLLANNSTDVNLENFQGMTPILQAVAAGSEGITRAILQRSDVNITKLDAGGRNALSLAASRGHADILQLLLDHGAFSTGFRDRFGQTALEVAAKQGHARVFDILRRFDSSISPNFSEAGRNAVLQTLCRGKSSLLRSILESEAIDRNAKDGRGRSLLANAAYRGYEDVVEMLLSLPGFNPVSIDCFGFTPLQWARLSGNNRMIDILRSHPSSSSSDPAHVSAALGRSTAALQILTEEGTLVPKPITRLVASQQMAGEIWCVSFSRDGHHLATGHDTGDVMIWESDPLAHVWTMLDHQEGVADISWSPDDSVLLSCGRDREAKLWDTEVSLYPMH